MLEELAKKDDIWRKKALQICKDRDLADEIVQEMYIKYYKNNVTKTDEFYVIATLRNLFIDHKKKPYNSEITEVPEYEKFQTDDKEESILKKLDWFEIELIEMNYDKSLREIGREIGWTHDMVRRTILNAKQKVML